MNSPYKIGALSAFLTPGETALQLAARLRELRLRQGWKRTTLSERSGVTQASLKRFERTGQISLASLLKLCLSLGRLGDFADILAPPAIRSLDELEARASTPVPKRGRR